MLKDCKLANNWIPYQTGKNTELINQEKFEKYIVKRRKIKNKI